MLDRQMIAPDWKFPGDNLCSGHAGRSAGSEEGRRELGLPPEGYHDPPAELWRCIFCAGCRIRLNEAENRCGGETVGRNGEAVPDLGGTTTMVPVGDAIEVEFLDEGSRPAETKAEEGVQAQREAVLPVRQDLRGLRLAGLSRVRVWSREKSDKRRIDVGNAGKIAPRGWRTHRPEIGQGIGVG